MGRVGRRRSPKNHECDHEHRRIAMAYVDGFLIPLPKRKIAEYRRIARKAGKVWRDHGALEYRECIGDDLKVKGMASFLKRAGVKPGETVVFSWVVYKSKADRKRIVAKVLADPRLADMSEKNSPFDVRRMAYGGFKVLVDL
jgi:uncharacterized protein YbaA (DUF1428 family)